MNIGRRPLFFLLLGVIGLLLLEPTPEKFRWVNLAIAGLAFFWFVLLSLEELTSRGPGRTRMRVDVPLYGRQTGEQKKEESR